MRPIRKQRGQTEEEGPSNERMTKNDYVVTKDKESRDAKISDIARKERPSLKRTARRRVWQLSKKKGALRPCSQIGTCLIWRKVLNRVYPTWLVTSKHAYFGRPNIYRIDECIN
jgi:hypothetical protein